MISSNGLIFSTSLVSPRTINVSDISLAPVGAPDAGASIIDTFLGALCLRCFMYFGDTVEQIINNFQSLLVKIPLPSTHSSSVCFLSRKRLMITSIFTINFDLLSMK